MLITQIAAQNILSFETLDLVPLDSHLNVIVGPNGSGKSNLIRVLKFLQDAVGWPSDAPSWAQDLILLRKLGGPNSFSVSLGIELSEEWERSLLWHFLRAALLSDESIPADQRKHFHDWARKKAFQEPPSFLYKGILKVALPDTARPDPEVTYECGNGGARLRWSLRDGIGPLGGDAWHGSPSAAFQRAIEAGSPPDGLIALLARGDHISLELQPDKLRDAPELLEGLAALTGEELDVNGNRFYTGSWVFHHLLQARLFITDNIRIPPQLSWSASDLESPPDSLSLANGSQIPLYLFRLSTGAFEQRKRYLSICQRFHDLTGLSLDITFARHRTGTKGTRRAISPAFGQPGGVAQEQVIDELEFDLVPLVSHPDGEVPIHLAGAGAWETLVLSASLARPGVVLALDEPALNLHPTAQRRLLKMLRQQETQVFLTTHSPYLVPSDEKADLTRVIRFELSRGATRSRRLPADVSHDHQRPKWVRWLSELTEVRSFLFARGVILVEGATEQGALSAWFAKSSKTQKRGAPEDLNISVFSVGGDQKFQTFISLLTAFDIPWAVVCDGKVFRDRQEKGDPKVSIFRQVRGAGIQLEEVAFKGANEFGDAKSIGAAYGVFTVAQDFPEEFEDYLKRRLPTEFAAAAKEWPKSKVLAGRMAAQQTDCPKEVGDLYAQILDWFNLPLGPAQGSGED